MRHRIKPILTILALTIPLFLSAQSKPKAYSSKSVEEKAKFIGGRQILAQMFVDSMRFPIEATVFCVKGTVPVAFVINEKGQAVDIRTIGSKKVGYGCEKEAIRLIEKTSGRWSPAKIKNKPVRQHKVISIRFNQSCSDINTGRVFSLHGHGTHDTLAVTPWKIFNLGQFPKRMDIDGERVNFSAFSKSIESRIYSEKEVDSISFFLQNSKYYIEDYFEASFVRFCSDYLAKDSLFNDDLLDGKYTVSFVVEPDRSVSNIKISNTSLPSEVTDLIVKATEESAGRWMPAVKDGKFVRSRRKISVFYINRQ